MSLDRITEIVRAKYAVSAYQYCHFEVAPDTWEFLRTTAAPSAPQWQGGSPIGQLFGLDVRVICVLAPMGWRVMRVEPAHFEPAWPDDTWIAEPVPTRIWQHVPTRTTLVEEGSLLAPGL